MPGAGHREGQFPEGHEGAAAVEIGWVMVSHAALAVAEVLRPRCLRMLSPVRSKR